MGKYRSRSGCLTCRARRVKCDEVHPVCMACKKKNRPCEWEAPHTKFKDYQPEASSSKLPTDGGDGHNHEKDMDVDDVDGEEHSRRTSPIRKNDRMATSSEGIPGSISSPSAQHSPNSEYTVLPSRSSTGGVSVASLLGTYELGRLPRADGIPKSYENAVSLTHDEAFLVHHYTENLGRWLDCTDATRQFTLGVPEKVKSCPVLCQAVLCFSARHCKDNETAEIAYQRCIALLIDRLNEDAASHDETLLCAIVILRFYEQLNVPSSTGSDEEQHLAGCSAIIRSSQGHHYVDPSAPTLREAAFWVYVRQCLYNATIHQQPPNIDFSLELHPTPGSMQDSHPLARLRLENGWANQMTWNTASVVNFCFEGSETHGERQRIQRWQELWDKVKAWRNDRPRGFDPVFENKSRESGVFPEIWFTADWHAVSFGFYHFACIMLLSYKPGPKFAIRNVDRLSDKDILDHARAICGASRSSPEIVPLSITVCHTIFIWGPLVSDPRERNEVLQLLVNFEVNHIWPTTWIISALKTEWAME
ncbi:hypothetical protein ACN47E_001380 [Coniothyrium glycines]